MCDCGLARKVLAKTFIGVHLTGMCLMGVHLTGVHLMGVHLMGVHLMSVHLVGVYLIYESSLRAGHGWRESLYRHQGCLKLLIVGDSAVSCWSPMLICCT